MIFLLRQLCNITHPWVMHESVKLIPAQFLSSMKECWLSPRYINPPQLCDTWLLEQAPEFGLCYSKLNFSCFDAEFLFVLGDVMHMWPSITSTLPHELNAWCHSAGFSPSKEKNSSWFKIMQVLMRANWCITATACEGLNVECSVCFSADITGVMAATNIQAWLISSYQMSRGSFKCCSQAHGRLWLRC